MHTVNLCALMAATQPKLRKSELMTDPWAHGRRRSPITGWIGKSPFHIHNPCAQRASLFMKTSQPLKMTKYKTKIYKHFSTT